MTFEAAVSTDSDQLLGELAHIGVVLAQLGQPVFPGGLRHVAGALDGRRGLARGRAGDLHLLLHRVDGEHDVVE